MRFQVWQRLQADLLRQRASGGDAEWEKKKGQEPVRPGLKLTGRQGGHLTQQALQADAPNVVLLKGRVGQVPGVTTSESRSEEDMQIKANLIDAVKNRQAVLFAGAGISWKAIGFGG